MIIARTIILILAIGFSGSIYAQSADQIYHASAGLYIHEKNAEAKAKLDDGIKKYPNDRKLNELRSKIKEDEKKEDQEKKDNEKKDDQEKQDQEKKEKDKKDKEKKDQEKKEQDQKEQQEKKDEKKDEKKEDMSSDKMKEMKISEEKAKMVLEAMKNQEVQYLQQNKRKATKPKSKGKPDW